MKLKYFIFSIITIFAISCSEDMLNTDPTDSVSGSRVFETVDNAYTAINGIYRAFYVYGEAWVDYYETENSGVSALQLAADLMGEDMLMDKAGSAWFWYDYRYWVRSEIYSTGDRPFAWWNMLYKFVNNANYILAYIDEAEGAEADKNNIKGQAFALRAYAYNYLVQLYQRTYIGNENAPGVPIYTEPTNNRTEGKGRGTVEEVYAQINSDLDSAISRLSRAVPQKHISHIDLYVAHGFKARVALTQNNWEVARDHANLAKQKSEISLMNQSELLGGFNSYNNEWMWGSEVNEEQSLSWPSFWSHMDADAGGYARNARKCISSWLFDQIGENDIRKAWFFGEDETNSVGPNFKYNQLKFRVQSEGSWANDLLYMRASEMYLIEAEARAWLGEYNEARNLLIELIGYKDPDLEDHLATIPDGNVLNLGAAGPVENLLDFIVLQRRIELWGEGFRIFDIQRHKTGLNRDFPDSNHPDKLVFDPDSWEWIMMIPQAEFDGNINLDPVADQNP